jgi:hypothetical protein
MSDVWFTNPRLEMGPDDFAPDDDGRRGFLEADYDETGEDDV